MSENLEDDGQLDFDVTLVTDSKNLFIGQCDKTFEEYWLSPIL